MIPQEPSPPKGEPGPGKIWVKSKRPPGRPHKPGTPDRKHRPRKNQAIRIMAQRSLEASDEEIRAFIPDERDVEMAEAMVCGSITFTEIADHIGVDPAIIGRKMKDPVRVAWMSMQVHRAVARRLGILDAALFRRAISGDTAALKLAYERFGEMQKRLHVRHTYEVNAVDPSRLTDADLDQLIATDAEYSISKNGPLALEPSQEEEVTDDE